MRIGVAQINSVLGDFKSNKTKIIEFAQRAKSKKCSLVVFPECSLFGYHPFDLLERPELVERQEKEFADLAKKVPEGIAVIVGLFTKSKKARGRPYYNSAALIEKGKKPKIFNKELLPTGDVFDEARFVEAGDLSKNYFVRDGKRFFITICEDIWAWEFPSQRSSYSYNPLKKIKDKNIDLVINLSASPYHVGKMKLREHVTLSTAKHLKAPILYVNLVGAQDEIVFDGGSFVMTPQGQKPVECMRFQEDLNVFDLDTLESWHKVEKLKPAEELRKALVLGIRDFCRKIGLKKVHLGLSGGIDSALVACLAADALGPGNVAALAMPGPYSESLSLDLAKRLAENLNIQLIEVPISESYDKVLQTFSTAAKYSGFSVVNENIQARLRGLFLMTYSNKEGSLLLTTGNKSEYATGYSTLYGDMCGGLAPIADLTKKQVYELSAYYNQQAEVIPTEIITRAPSAELRPNQKDQDSLPPYDELDRAVVRVVEKQAKVSSPLEKWLIQKLYQSEFKRWQAPPIIKVSRHSFGRGRRLPVAHKC